MLIKIDWIGDSMIINQNTSLTFYIGNINTRKQVKK